MSPRMETLLSEKFPDERDAALPPFPSGLRRIAAGFALPSGRTGGLTERWNPTAAAGAPVHRGPAGAALGLPTRGTRIQYAPKSAKLRNKAPERCWETRIHAHLQLPGAGSAVSIDGGNRGIEIRLTGRRPDLKTMGSRTLLPVAELGILPPAT